MNKLHTPNMPHRYLLFLLLLSLPIHAQTRLDPAFQPVEVYAPAQLNRALELVSGARVCWGTIERAEGRPVRQLVRYKPTGVPDTVFNNNIQAQTWNVVRFAAAPGDKLVLDVFDPAQRRVLRLNADGTQDSGFTPLVLTGNEYSAALLVQADGKVLVGGFLLQGGNLRRLNADGTPDASFQAAGLAGGVVDLLALDNSGRILVAGTFTTVQGVARPQLARLLTTGALDPSFAPALPAAARLFTLAVQPDNAVLVASPRTPLMGTHDFIRFTASGAADPTFLPQPEATPLATAYPNVEVQPDGRVLVATGISGQGFSYVARLLSTGARDASFAVADFGDLNLSPYSLQLLSSGQVLVAGVPRHFSASTDLPTGVAVLSSTGAYVSAFNPALRQTGSVLALELQPDGRLLIAGSFCEINNQPARNLARLEANGALDQQFTASSTLTGGPGEYATSLALQADGKVVVGGGFGVAGGLPRQALARFLPTGQPDAAYAPPMQTTPYAYSIIQRLALQPDGQVLAAGNVALTGNRFRSFSRFEPVTGGLDPAFQPVTSGAPGAVLVQPNGAIVVVGTTPTPSGAATVAQLLPSGALDPSFAPVLPPSGFSFTSGLARYPDGRLLVYGYGSTSVAPLQRLLPNGQPDPSPVVGNALRGSITCLTIQPNERLLAGGLFETGSGPNAYEQLARLQPDGSLDPTLDRTLGPAVRSYITGYTTSLQVIRVQPNGALLLGGSFLQVGGQVRRCVARLLGGNVLGDKSQATQSLNLQVWPVPVRDVLHLTLSSSARRAQLLDPVGRVVRSQEHPPREATFSTAGLPAGTYLLRVDSDAGPLMRRVVVE
ncbi:delta-60 repeat domain-containing protein [Hymenobacter terrigena]